MRTKTQAQISKQKFTIWSKFHQNQKKIKKVTASISILELHNSAPSKLFIQSMNRKRENHNERRFEIITITIRAFNVYGRKRTCEASVFSFCSTGQSISYCKSIFSSWYRSNTLSTILRQKFTEDVLIHLAKSVYFIFSIAWECHFNFFRSIIW